MSVYLVHFDRPFGHARHYSGYATNLGLRMAHHRAGTGANLLRHVKDAGIGWTLVRVWPGAGRTFERRLKNRGGAARLCPLCRATSGKAMLPDGGWLVAAGAHDRRCRCGDRAVFIRPWGRGRVGLCARCAARYARRRYGAIGGEW